MNLLHTLTQTTKCIASSHTVGSIEIIVASAVVVDIAISNASQLLVAEK